MTHRSILFVLVAILSIGTAAVLLIPSQEAEAYIGDCDCGPWRTTATLTGHGVGCQNANYNLLSQLTSAANCGPDGFCEYDVTITRACYNDEPGSPTWKKIDGYLHYQCSECQF